MYESHSANIVDRLRLEAHLRDEMWMWVGSILYLVLLSVICVASFDPVTPMAHVQGALKPRYQVESLKKVRDIDDVMNHMVMSIDPTPWQVLWWMQTHWIVLVVNVALTPV